MDTNEEERAKGKTVEVGRAHFETEHKRYTVLDAPGHKNYASAHEVPAMIGGASQADVGVLVISARKGEFEAGFDRLGQTREHAMLAKTLGVQKLVVVINKMDEQTVKWSRARYDECVKKLTPFLKSCGYRVKKDVMFLPLSALTGANVLERVKSSECAWGAQCNSGRSLIQTLDNIVVSGREPNGPIRLPVIDKYTDRGLIVMAKVESGTVCKGSKLTIVPPNLPCKVDSVMINEVEVDEARPGENVRVKLKGLNEEDVTKGFVLCDTVSVLKPCSTFVAQIAVLELLEHRSIFTAGYNAVFHAHTAIEECSIRELLKEVNRKTGKPLKKTPMFVKSGAIAIVRIETAARVCIEPYEQMMQLGRFTLRDEGKTIAIGKVLKIE